MEERPYQTESTKKEITEKEKKTNQTNPNTGTGTGNYKLGGKPELLKPLGKVGTEKKRKFGLNNEEIVNKKRWTTTTTQSDSDNLGELQMNGGNRRRLMTASMSPGKMQTVRNQVLRILPENSEASIKLISDNYQ